MKEKRVRKLKKSFAVDAHAYEVLRAFTETHGISLSSWLSGLLVEVARKIEGQPSPWDRPIRQMTIDELADAMKYWTKLISEEETEGPEKFPKA